MTRNYLRRIEALEQTHGCGACKEECFRCWNQRWLSLGGKYEDQPPRWNPADREGHPCCDNQPGNGEWIVETLEAMNG